MTMLHSTLGMLGLACCLALPIAACDPQPGPDDDEASFRDGGDWGCRTCGYTNSPVFGEHPIDRFRVSGKAAGDLRLVALENPAGVQYPATVQAQSFVATTPAGLVQGSGLIGWSLVLDDGAFQRSVRISSFQTHPDWVLGQPIPTYGLAYLDPEDPEAPLANVCPDFDPDETSVVLIADELYDVEKKTVSPNESGWVTMACRGHALMKLKFLGHDPNDDYGSQWEQRQAALKMLTADYCGHGHSFTALGEPLEWVDELGNFPAEALPSIDSVEAKWSEDGALCLDQPRLVARSEVDAHCILPTCDGDMDLGSARWMSLIPKP